MPKPARSTEMFPDRELRSLSEGKRPVPGPDCLSDEELALVSGSEDKAAASLLAHVAECDWCGERLRTLIQVQRQGLTDQEEALLAGLPRRHKEQPKRVSRNPNFI